VPIKLLAGVEAAAAGWAPGEAAAAVPDQVPVGVAVVAQVVVGVVVEFPPRLPALGRPNRHHCARVPTSFWSAGRQLRYRRLQRLRWAAPADTHCRYEQPVPKRPMTRKHPSRHSDQCRLEKPCCAPRRPMCCCPWRARRGRQAGRKRYSLRPCHHSTWDHGRDHWKLPGRHCCSNRVPTRRGEASGQTIPEPVGRVLRQ